MTMPFPADPRDTGDAVPAGHDIPVHLLRILRLQIQNLQQPQNGGALRGMHLAVALWGETRGPQVFYHLAMTFDQMRRARRSPFNYSNPDCACCADKITPNEKLFLQVIGFQRAGAAGKAHASAFLLCEANPSLGFLDAAERLAKISPSYLPGPPLS
jgi:hypothetical protein